MVVVLVVIVLALLAAASVVLLASTAAAPGGDGSAWESFRRGWRSRRHPDADQLDAARAAAVEPVDLSLAQFLRETAEVGDAYLNVDELAEDLQRARDRAVRPLKARRSA